MLNLVQHPCAVIRTKGGARVAAGRAWTLKQVQGDEVSVVGVSERHGR
jgi:hypothetical protein